MAHMKLKKIPRKKKFKYIFILLIIYIIFSYTFYYSFKNISKTTNEEFINYLLNNGNINFDNKFKFNKLINKSLNLLLKIDLTKPITLFNENILGYNEIETDNYQDFEKLKEVSF